MLNGCMFVCLLLKPLSLLRSYNNMKNTDNLVADQAHTRIEKDLLGEQAVPATALYGIQTQRAAQNFDITGVSISHFPDLIKALAMVKAAAAKAD